MFTVAERHLGPVAATISKVGSRESPPRFTVRAHLPERLSRWSHCRSTCAGHGTNRRKTCSMPSTRDCGSRSAADPVALLGRSLRTVSTNSPVTSASSAARPFVGHLDDYLARPLWYQERPVRGRRVAERHRVLLDGVRCRRGAAQLLRWSGHPGRRPPENRRRIWACRLIAVGLHYRSGTSGSR